MDYNDYNQTEYNQTKTYFQNEQEQDPNFYKNNDDVVSLSTWIIVLIVTAIPIVNIIVLLVLAIGDHNLNLKNYAKASLIILLVGYLFTFSLGGCAYSRYY